MINRPTNTIRNNQKKQAGLLALFFLLLPVACGLLPDTAFANNVSVSNVKLQNLDATAGTIEIKFDLSWDNTFNGTDENGQAFFDRAWVFAKFYRADTGVWDHVPLSTGGTVAAYNTTDKTGITADGVGAFLKPGANQTFVWQYTHVPVTLTIASPCVVTYTNHGLPANSPITFSTTGALPTGITAGNTYYVKAPTANTFNISTTPGGANVNTSGSQSGQQRINAPAIMFGDNVRVKVFAIEMVYIPQGSFVVGSGGTENNAFYTYPTTTNPYAISSENAINVGTTNGYLYCPSVTNSYPGDRVGPIPAAFPKGYNGFFVMKYEITQGQYRDFLNSLTRAQQNYRTETSLSAGTTSVTNRYVMSSSSTMARRNGIRCDASIHTSNPITFYCDFNGNGIPNEADDGEWIACNYLSWADMAAYMDWSGLRPITELEYEKAVRGGGMAPVANEYAWGTTTITGATEILNPGQNTEAALPDTANCNYYNLVADAYRGPMRSGAMASLATSREQAGASYYGLMDLSGNLWIRTITVGHSSGRAFTGLNGDGFLITNGDYNVTNWPPTSGNGTGLRSGTWSHEPTYARISDRYFAASASSSRANTYGGRAGRTAD
ncbi:MAG: SUMF1/EgtB/PvdO family nonheme iron enzyme [Candidatus Omnitrophota bacterium]